MFIYPRSTSHKSKLLDSYRPSNKYAPYSKTKCYQEEILIPNSAQLCTMRSHNIRIPYLIAYIEEYVSTRMEVYNADIYTTYYAGIPCYAIHRYTLT